MRISYYYQIGPGAIKEKQENQLEYYIVDRPSEMNANHKPMGKAFLRTSIGRSYLAKTLRAITVFLLIEPALQLPALLLNPHLYEVKFQ